MGVYIKGIGLPEYGECYVIEPNGIVLNSDNRCVGVAVEIKEPHGDLIDRDNLKRSVKDNKEYFRRGECCNYFYNNADEPSTELWCVDDWVDEQPTIIERSEDE